MTGRMKLYIGLMVLGLLLIGSGLWFLFNPIYVIDIPEGEPIITMHNSFRTIGNGPNHLRIYQDGNVIYTEEKGIGQEATRIWRTGQLENEELASLFTFFSDSSFGSLDELYEFSGESANGGTKTGGMACAILINDGHQNKTVNANWYLSPDGGITYPDMPYPLNEIYERLRAIIEDKTEEVYQESIKVPYLLRDDNHE